MAVNVDPQKPAGFSNPILFWIGTLLVAGGVIAHLPMYWMGKNNGFHLADMPMDLSMWLGMAAIPAGIALAYVGFCPTGNCRAAPWPRRSRSPTTAR